MCSKPLYLAHAFRLKRNEICHNMVQDNFEYHHFEQNISVLRKFKYKYLLFINKNFIFKSNMIDMLYNLKRNYMGKFHLYIFLEFSRGCTYLYWAMMSQYIYLP